MSWSLEIKAETPLFLRFLKIILIVQTCFGERLGQQPAGQAAGEHGQGCKSLSAKGVVEKTRKEYSDHTSVPCTALSP